MARLLRAALTWGRDGSAAPGCADMAAAGCAGILGDFRWSPRDLLEEKTGGAKGFLDFVFHLVSLSLTLYR